MRKTIFIIFISTVFGFSNVSQLLKNEQKFWDSSFKGKINMFISFQSDAKGLEEHQTIIKTCLSENCRN